MPTPTARTATLVAGKDLRERARDRTAYLLALVVPVLITTIITLAFGRSDVDFATTFAVSDADGGQLSRALVDGVLKSEDLADAVTVTEVGTAEEVDDLVAGGDAGAGIVIPAGFTLAARGADPLPVTVVRSADSPVAGDVAESVVGSFVAQVDTVRLAVATVGDAAPAEQVAQQVAVAPPAVALVQDDVDTVSVSPATQYAPAMGVFFMFFAIGGQAQSIVAERRQGTWARLLASPVRPRGLLVGKATSGFTLGVVSLGTLIVVSSLVLGASWGSPLGVALLVLSTAFAVTGVFAVVISVAKTERAANGLSSIVTFGFALLGGNFVSLSGASEAVQNIALLTPNGWALRGFSDLAAEGGDVAVVLPSVAVLVLMGVVGFAVAITQSRRLVHL